MSIEQTANALTFYAFYAAEGVGKTGLTVTVDVYRGATQIVTGAAVTAIGGGLYSYTLSAGAAATESEYIAVFKTTDLTVDARHIPALWTVGKAGIEYLDAAISSRAAAGSTVTVSSSVASNGNATVVQGKDYTSTLGNALAWTLSPVPSPAPSAVTLTCVMLGLSKAGTWSSPTATFELTAAETAAMRYGTFDFEVEGTFSGSAKRSLVTGTITVAKDV